MAKLTADEREALLEYIRHCFPPSSTPGPLPSDPALTNALVAKGMLDPHHGYALTAAARSMICLRDE